MPIADCRLPIAYVLIFATASFAQESPTPSPSPSSSPSPSFSLAPQQGPSSSPVRNIRISFVPPPMEGTISLGIFDSNRKLVRILDREAKIDSFTINENSLSTTWDGKNDAGEDLPPGKYHARGYMVDHQLNVTDFGESTLPQGNASDHITVKLEINPLVNDTRSVVELAVGFDTNGSFLKTMDDLPLRTISRSTTVARAWITKQSDTVVDVWEDNSAKIERFELKNIHAMMAFDCGDFQLK
jgi:hypothetical protein